MNQTLSSLSPCTCPQPLQYLEHKSLHHCTSFLIAQWQACCGINRYLRLRHFHKQPNHSTNECNTHWGTKTSMDTTQRICAISRACCDEKWWCKNQLESACQSSPVRPDCMAELIITIFVAAEAKIVWLKSGFNVQQNWTQEIMDDDTEVRICSLRWSSPSKLKFQESSSDSRSCGDN